LKMRNFRKKRKYQRQYLKRHPEKLEYVKVNTKEYRKKLKNNLKGIRDI